MLFQPPPFYRLEKHSTLKNHLPRASPPPRTSHAAGLPPEPLVRWGSTFAFTRPYLRLALASLPGKSGTPSPLLQSSAIPHVIKANDHQTPLAAFCFTTLQFIILILCASYSMMSSRR